MNVTPEGQTEKPKTNTKKFLIGCGVLLGAVILIAVGIGTCLGNTESPVAEVDINPSIRFDGSQFTITNHNTYDWTDVTFELNAPGVFTSGYKYHASRIAASTTYTLGALQFAKSDGTRFNPYTTKPTTISINCKTPSGATGSWSGGWD